MPAIIAYPKWVPLHTSYVKKNTTTGNISVPLWSNVFIARDGTVSALCNNANEEAKALANQ